MPIIYRKYEPPQTSVPPATAAGDENAAASRDAPRETAERDLTAIRQLISQDLSEPYGIYVYRYFIYQWPHLCFLALDTGVRTSPASSSTEPTTAEKSPADAGTQTQEDNLVGVVVCKLASHRGVKLRGYIAMLAVATTYRGRGIATKLVRLAIDCMIEDGAEEIVLETEVDNESAIRLYERMGFIRSKRMHRYYMNASDAFRLVLPVKVESTIRYCVLANELDTSPHNGGDGEAGASSGAGGMYI
ncbi:acyl-CoA N-acyltransferase [Lipomyces chichibuensis]|uniref:acyl-CoA N-acyltransferase n=1 Tax=Lipomyces chichibuensis TaxID=1546026 RepID=UPI003343AEBA